ncbi:MAG: hypothetical protein K2X03_22495 [Bryobacteraceae bacterium]|nr:hypothetical protein [Bryobacteraceae bacterium]
MSKAGRSQWFSDRSAQPGHEADVSALVGARAAGNPAIRWESLGPFNVGGRATSLVVDPREPRRVWLGSAAGGVWVSSDSGKTWESVWDDDLVQNIGALALDPRAPHSLFVGTGEANLTLDSYPGTGLYQSAGGGWALIGGTQRADTGDPLPSRIGAIAIDHVSPRGHILLGSASTVRSEPAGLYEGHELADGSWEWKAISGFVFGGDPQSQVPVRASVPYRCHSVLFHPERSEAIVSVNLRGWRSGLWRCCDGEWQQLTKGLPPSEAFGRVSLARAPSDPDVLWAYAGHRREGMLGVFFSRNGGDTWHATGEDYFAQQRSTHYNNCIAVHPQHPDQVICGGQDLHRSTDGGQTWEQITEFNLPPHDPHYAHADHHALAITPDGWVYDANDSGLAFSENFGASWQTREAGLVTTMFYDLDVAPTHAEVISGGAQDNGTLVHNLNTPKGLFSRVLSGDGGWTVFNPDDASHLWGSSQHINIAVANNGRFRDATPDGLDEEETGEVWMSYLAMDTSAGRAQPRPVLLGTTRIWKTIDNGVSWKPASPVLDGSTVTAIEIADANPRFVYAGTQRGGVFRSVDGGNYWSENLAGVDLPYRLITRMESHPQNHRHVLLTIAATPPAQKGAERRAYGHVFLSLDAGLTWRNANPDLRLPNVPHTSLAFETVAPFRAFVGTDIGVFAGRWDGAKYAWENVSGTLPNVIVTDLVYHRGAQALFAATYGRGIYRLDVRNAK